MVQYIKFNKRYLNWAEYVKFYYFSIIRFQVNQSQKCYFIKLKKNYLLAFRNQSRMIATASFIATPHIERAQSVRKVHK